MKMGIAFRLSTSLLACSIIIFGCILRYDYVVSRNLIIEQAIEKGDYLAKATGKQITEVFNVADKVIDGVAYSLEKGEITKERIKIIENRVLNKNPEIFGTAIAFEPYSFDASKLYYSPYRFRAGNRIDYINLGKEDFQYFFMDWYQLAKELKKPVWTEPYFDEGSSQVLMITYASPFYRMKNNKMNLTGIVTADIALDWIQNIISEIEVCETGYVFLLSRYGAYIAHPDKNLIIHETIFSHAEELKIPELRHIGRKMRTGESGFAEIENFPDLGDVFIYYFSLPVEHWSFGVVFPKSELLADVTHLSTVMIVIGILGFIILTSLIFYLAQTITKPLRQLTYAVQEIASGNLDLKLPRVKTKDEVGELTNSFRQMRDSLKTYIINLTKTTAVKERIESELSIAREIQMDILPKLFPAFPERDEFDIFAFIEPAREVGGDLYDFFFIDDNHFCFLVGDVSGKGVPAAFFMAVTKTLLKVVAERGLEPGEIFVKVNNDLAEKNDSCMFATLFLAILDVKTGNIRYANAGHNPPLLILTSGSVEWIPSVCEPMVGAMQDIEYTTGTMTLNHGDTLFLYTDGVTEAMNHNHDLYSDERLFETISLKPKASSMEMVMHVNDTILSFADGAEQSDDITMLALKYCKNEKGE